MKILISQKCLKNPKENNTLQRSLTNNPRLFTTNKLVEDALVNMTNHMLDSFVAQKHFLGQSVLPRIQLGNLLI